MTTAAQRTVRIFCHAAWHRVGAPPLGDIPAVGELRFVGNSRRLPAEPDGRLWLRCHTKECGSWNCFELVNGDGVA